MFVKTLGQLKQRGKKEMLINLICKIIEFTLNLIFFCFLGIIRLFLSSTKQQKVTMFLCLSVTTIDIYYIYPFTGNHPIHVFILFLPITYLFMIGKGEVT